MKGRFTQPSFKRWQLIQSFIGGLIAIRCIGILSNLSTYPLLIESFEASAVFLFLAPNSPIAQPRNLIFRNLVVVISAILCVFLLGSSYLTSGIAVGLTIFLGQAFLCLHPPAGAVAFLGVLLKASSIFIFIPVISGSLKLLGIALVFNRFLKREQSYPIHWL